MMDNDYYSRLLKATFIVICGLRYVYCVNNEILSNDLTKYLHRKHRDLVEKQVELFKRNKDTLGLSPFLNIQIPENTTNAHIFTIKNIIHVLLNEALFKISDTNYTLIHKFPEKDEISIVRTIDQSNFTIVLLVTKSANINVYGIDANTNFLFKIQEIHHTDISDAIFMENVAGLYLVVSTNKGDNLANTIFYKFYGTHFDEISRIITVGAFKLHAFNDNERTIVAIIQYLRNRNINSVLYELNHNHVNKIQNIEIRKPKFSCNYKFDNKDYVIIIEKASKLAHFIWTGTKLMLLNKYPINVNTNDLNFLNCNKTPSIFLVNNKSLSIFAHLNNKINTIRNPLQIELNFTQIWDFQIFNDILFVVGRRGNNYIDLYKISTLLSSDNTTEPDLTHSSGSCISILENTLYLLRSRIKLIQNKTVQSTRSIRSSKLDNINEELLERAFTKYVNINSTLHSYSIHSNNMVINGKTIISSSINASRGIGKNINYERLNSNNWLKDQWLTYSKLQILPAINAELVKINFMDTRRGEILFNDLSTTKNLNLVLKNVKNLDTKIIETKTINGIPVENVSYKNRKFEVRGFKKIQRINIDTLTNNNKVIQLLKGNFKLDNLWVKNVNGVDLDKFNKSVFKVNSTSGIDGTLTFTQNITTKRAIFKSVSQFENYLTTSTTQIVNSSIFIDQIFSKNIETNLTNNIDLSENISSNNSFNGPVKTFNVSIKNNVKLIGKINKSFVTTKNDHIVGTNESDLLQLFNKKVKIHGNLTIKFLNLGINSKIFYPKSKFSTELDKFWLKSKNQLIPSHFEALRGLSTSQLRAKLINNVDINDFMINSDIPKESTKFYFENAIIKGNTLLSPTKIHVPDLFAIQEHAIKFNHTLNIKGHTIYSGKLKVDTLIINCSDQAYFDNVICKIGYNQSFGNKSIPNLIVQGNVLSDVSTNLFNNRNISRLQQDTLKTDRGFNVDQLNFKKCLVENMQITNTLNEHSMHNYSNKVRKMNEIASIDAVYLIGNGKFQDIQNMMNINKNTSIQEFPINNMINNTIHGQIHFSGRILLKNIHFKTVNDVNFPKLFQRLFFKDWRQEILHDQFIFKNIKASNTIANEINRKFIGNLISISTHKAQRIRVLNGLNLKDFREASGLRGNLLCNLDDSMKNFRSPRPMWKTVRVNGNVHFWDPTSHLNQIVDNAITNGQYHSLSIRNYIRFAKHICTLHITALKNINDIDITRIVDDALLMNSVEEQVVSHKKMFSQLSTGALLSFNNMDIVEINEINLKEVNRNIKFEYSPEKILIKGNKTFFGGIQTRRFWTQIINNIIPNNLVSLSTLQKIPQAVFDNVTIIDRLNVKYINNMKLHTILKNRFPINLKKQHITATYFFKDIFIDGLLEVNKINNVEFKNVVTDSGFQTIESKKRFSENVYIVGESRIEYVNLFSISDYYRDVLTTDESLARFQGNLMILQPSIVVGHITVNNINNYPINLFNITQEQNLISNESGRIQEITEAVSKFVNKNLNYTRRLPTEFLYLEKSTTLQIRMSPTISAQVLKTNDGILMHLGGEEGGNFCGLSKLCKCPVQYTMQISNDHSISTFINKATQRIYTYYNDDMTIEVITNSISSDEQCRNTQAIVRNEMSSITWTITSTHNNAGGFYMYPKFFSGYVTGVEFFTIEKYTYIVLGRYYDPVENTHSLNCSVLKFNEDKTELEEIQSIPTSGLKTMSLIHTAQGVILIMGSATDRTMYENTNTNIFRFNPILDQFELLRSVPYFGAISAVGVIFRLDSLIILANRQFTLYVLKYQSEFDNYYFHQSFQLTSPISSMSVFYAGDFGMSDAYLGVVTDNSKYHIYSFRFMEGWKLESFGELSGIKGLIPFNLNNQLYLFAPSSTQSTLLCLTEHDST